MKLSIAFVYSLLAVSTASAAIIDARQPAGSSLIAREPRRGRGGQGQDQNQQGQDQNQQGQDQNQQGQDQNQQGQDQQNGNNSTQASATSGDLQSSTTLDPSVIATGFAQNGQSANGSEAGQVASLTSTNNFINFCATVPNLPITNGLQIKTGSCNPAPMGVIAAQTVMPASKFVNPKNFDNIEPNTAFTITMTLKNLEAGNFVNAQSNYYSAPQQVNAQGQIIGHSHFVIEPIDSFTSTTPLNNIKFAFFKGVNTPQDANGNLNVDVDKGLPAGTYRLASINAAANHQPALVAVAQHGSLDDMVYFTVGANSSAAAAGAGAAQAGQDASGAQAGQDASGAQAGQDASGAQAGQDASGAQAGQDASGAQAGQDASGAQAGQDASGAQAGQDASGAQAGQDASGAQAGQDASGAQAGQDASGAQAGQDGQDAQAGQDAQGAQAEQGGKRRKGRKGGQKRRFSGFSRV